MMQRAKTDPSCWAGIAASMGHVAVSDICCVPVGIGQSWCFDGAFTYERCCGDYLDLSSSLRLPLRSGLIRDEDKSLLVHASAFPVGSLRAQLEQEASEISMELFVRTHHDRLTELQVLLRSVQAFWPASWGVVVVLDASPGSDASLAELARFRQEAEVACSMLHKQSRLRCSLEDLPTVYKHFPQSAVSAAQKLNGMKSRGDKRRYRGYHWHVWSMLYADKHTSAEFVALIDTDTVLVSMGLPRILFALEKSPAGRPQPVIFGQAQLMQNSRSTIFLGLPWVAEFMDAFPMVIHRKHFGAFRAHLVEWNKQSGGNTTVLHSGRFIASGRQRRPFAKEPPGVAPRSWERRVAAAFVILAHKVAASGEQVFGMQSSLGNFLWHFYRDEYAWSVKDGLSINLPPEYTCPRLRAAQHLPYWGWTHSISLPQLRLHGPSAVAASAYVLRAEQLIMSGLCAVPWRLQAQDHRYANVDAASGTNQDVSGRHQPLDDGWLEVRREMCADVSDEVRSFGDAFVHTPVLGANLSQSKLLAAYFPSQVWTEVEAAYCGGLRPSAILEDYRQLMSGLVYLANAP